MPDELPKVSQNVPVIVEFIEELIEKGHAYEVDGDVYFRVASFRDYGKLSGQRPGRAPGAGAEREEGGPARLRALEGEEGGRGHVLELAVGPRPAGLAHRVLRDGREHPRRDVRDPRRRHRPALPAPRERARAVARARPRLRADLGAQRARALHRREDVEVRGQRHHDPRGGRQVGPRGAAALLPRRPLAQAGRLLRRDDGAGAGAGRDVPQRVHAAEGEAEAPVLGRLRRRARGRLRHAERARSHARVGLERPARPARPRRSRSSGSSRCPSRSRRRRRSWRSPRRARPRARRTNFEEADRLRDELAAAGWEMRDRIGGYVLRQKKT